MHESWFFVRKNVEILLMIQRNAFSFVISLIHTFMQILGSCAKGVKRQTVVKRNDEVKEAWISDQFLNSQIITKTFSFDSC